VAEAKLYAAQLPGGPAIDLPAGPSELLVIADETADPAMIAADLLSQAEHDADAQVLLVSLSAALANSVDAEIERQVSQLPRRMIARAALEEARTIIVRSRAEAAEVSNLYAPEHLSLQLRDAGALVADIACAGTIFVGAWSAETFGDYVAGPSHVLPTDGAARACSGISVSSFMTSFVVQQVSREAAAAMAPAAARLARLEGLEAHARAAEIRAVV
jgi:histidinol dehydrogenase